jgi:hypothetical protein
MLKDAVDSSPRPDHQQKWRKQHKTRIELEKIMQSA